jgi:hypothetical protein
VRKVFVSVGLLLKSYNSCDNYCINLVMQLNMRSDGLKQLVFGLHNVKAFVFVAEFEIRQLGTNADVKYKSSLLV